MLSSCPPAPVLGQLPGPGGRWRRSQSHSSIDPPSHRHHHHSVYHFHSISHFIGLIIFDLLTRKRPNCSPAAPNRALSKFQFNIPLIQIKSTNNPLNWLTFYWGIFKFFKNCCGRNGDGKRRRSRKHTEPNQAEWGWFRGDDSTLIREKATVSVSSFGLYLLFTHILRLKLGNCHSKKRYSITPKRTISNWKATRLMLRMNSVVSPEKYCSHFFI